MTGHQTPVSPLSLYECYWACAGCSPTCTGETGVRHIEANSAEEAVRKLREHPSYYGLPHMHPIVGHPIRVEVREAPVDLNAAA